MKRAFTFFISFAFFIPILMSCNEGKQQVTPSKLSETNEQVKAFKNISLVPMTDEKIVKDQTVLVKGTRILEIGQMELTYPKMQSLSTERAPT